MQLGLFDPPGNQAPRYQADPIGWNIWYLQENLELYREFRRRADQHAAAGKTVRANRVIQELRFETALHGSDTFKINDHASGMFARMYLMQRPGAEVEIQRKGHWKELSKDDRKRIWDAFIRLKNQGLI